jgi:hypothetical protein
MRLPPATRKCAASSTLQAAGAHFVMSGDSEVLMCAFVGERALERGAERALERAGERALERGAERALERAGEHA